MYVKEREGDREEVCVCDRTLEKMMMEIKSVIEVASDACVFAFDILLSVSRKQILF